MSKKIHAIFTFLFLAIIFLFPIYRFAGDLYAKKSPVLWEFFSNIPTSENLRNTEKKIENLDPFVKWVRSWYPLFMFHTLRDNTGNLIEGNAGWYFLKRSLDSITQKGEIWSNRDLEKNAIEFVRILNNDLEHQGIKLLVVPVPNKESVYADKLKIIPDKSKSLICIRTKTFFNYLNNYKIEFVNLFDKFSEKRDAEGFSQPLYLKHDSHWSPHGAEIAAQVVSQKISQLNLVKKNPYIQILEQETIKQNARIDLFQMVHQDWRPREYETIQLNPIDISYLSKPNEKSTDILIVGDSFLNSYLSEKSGFGAHLSKNLSCSVEQIVVIGSSAQARVQIGERLKSQPKPKILVWLFVERKLAMSTGLEGDWKTEHQIEE